MCRASGTPPAIAVGIMAPGRLHLQTDQDGKNWKLISMGYRNQYDAAFNRDGELFTYDADMEWDMNTPWYRPTRVCHAVPGSEFGWRGGTGKMYEYHPDNLPPVVNVGPGSPTGITFGYGAKFPAKYQEALFLCDWSLRQALRLSSHAQRCVLYRRTGGVLDRLAVAAYRYRDQSQGWRHVLHHRRPQHHVGPVPRYLCRQGIDETLQRETSDSAAAVKMAHRHQLESLYGKKEGAATRAWPFLSDNDRFLRFAARTVLEFQDPADLARQGPARKPTPSR